MDVESPEVCHSNGRLLSSGGAFFNAVQCCE